MKNQEDIVLIGAGLVGSLLSLFLAKQGYRVAIYERRPDLRKVNISAGRSINLALANRGIYPLQQVGVMSQVEPLLIPMRGRMLHDETGKLQFQPYGQKPHEVIYSISRKLLNNLLMDEAEKTGRVHIFFQHTCHEIDFDTQKLTVLDEFAGQQKIIPFTRVIGTDGSSSFLRKAIMDKTKGVHSEDELGHSYKELTIPSRSDGLFAMEKEALHIWPRGEFMLIALPNLDGSFTVTLFLPNTGEESFSSINDKLSLMEFFKKYFPDVIPLSPHLIEDFFDHPTGRLATVRCQPWHYKDQLLLMGDSAHAIVPFHGQGMNCGFEDCAVFSQCMSEFSDWNEIFANYQKLRKPNCDAVADLALENYVEMRSTVREKSFQLQKQIAFKLEQMFPDLFIPRYSMVMFHRIPYLEAKERGLKQQSILEQCTKGISQIDEVDWHKAKQLVEKTFNISG